MSNDRDKGYALMEFLEKIAESVKHAPNRYEDKDMTIFDSYNNICNECGGLLKTSRYWHVFPKERCKCPKELKEVPRNPKPTKEQPKYNALGKRKNSKCNWR